MFIRDKNKIEDFERERENSQCWRMRNSKYSHPTIKNTH